VAFRVVEDGPGRAARACSRFAADDAFAPESFHRGREVGNLEKQDNFIGRGIIFRAFAFETQERVAGRESCVVSGGFIGERKAKNIAVEFFRASKVVKIQFDARNAELGSLRHGLPPATILRRYATLSSSPVVRPPGIGRDSLTVARRSSKLLVSTGRAIRSSARAAINCEGEDRCRNALFSRMCGADIKSTGFASA
jgi:hypothetical protein